MRPFLTQIRDYPPPRHWDDNGRHAADDPLEVSQGPAVRPLRTIIAAALTPIGTALVTAPGMTRFHRPACPLAAGKPVQPVRPDEADGAGLVPCGVCAA